MYPPSLYACSAIAARLNAHLGQIQVISQRLQQMEQSNQQTTQHKEQRESTCVHLVQQLGQYVRNCQQEINQIACHMAHRAAVRSFFPVEPTVAPSFFPYHYAYSASHGQDSYPNSSQQQCFSPQLATSSV
ncbi:hypothetical protein [Pasteuria penetrans]|uniref:hypothetical protein n=1 Tax=Pasteuria penetrans TaxID=86005 RepID=UPI000FB583BF|nr:hypothetical protein [Pasteuria penetrans]